MPDGLRRCLRLPASVMLGREPREAAGATARARAQAHRVPCFRLGRMIWEMSWMIASDLLPVEPSNLTLRNGGNGGGGSVGCALRRPPPLCARTLAPKGLHRR